MVFRFVLIFSPSHPFVYHHAFFGGSLYIYIYQKRPAGKKGTYENPKKPRGTQRIKNVLGVRHPLQRQEATAQENGTDGALFFCGGGVVGGILVVGGGIYIT